MHVDPLVLTHKGAIMAMDGALHLEIGFRGGVRVGVRVRVRVRF